MTAPKRIWVAPCHPCNNPDDYYVLHPAYYRGSRGTSYVRADLAEQLVEALRAVDVVGPLDREIKQNALEAWEAGHEIPGQNKEAEK